MFFHEWTIPAPMISLIIILLISVCVLGIFILVHYSRSKAFSVSEAEIEMISNPALRSAEAQSKRALIGQSGTYASISLCSPVLGHEQYDIGCDGVVICTNA